MTTGNLPIQAFTANVNPEQPYKVTVNFEAGLDLTGAEIWTFQRAKRLSVIPGVVVNGQQIVVTYSQGNIEDLPSVSQHWVHLPAHHLVTMTGWTFNVSNRFVDVAQDESSYAVSIGGDGQVITVIVPGVDTVASLVVEAIAAKDAAEVARAGAEAILPITVAIFAANTSSTDPGGCIINISLSSDLVICVHVFYRILNFKLVPDSG